MLQPNRLITWKKKNIMGILVHVLILLIVNLVFLFPYLGYQGFVIGLLLVYLTPFLEDVWKVEFVKRYPNREFPAFVFDQVVHFTAFTILYWYALELIPNLSNPIFAFLYGSIWPVLFLLFITTSSYIYDIIEFQIKRIKNKELKYKRNYYGMVKRTIIIIIILSILNIII